MNCDTTFYIFLNVLSTILGLDVIYQIRHGHPTTTTRILEVCGQNTMSYHRLCKLKFDVTLHRWIPQTQKMSIEKQAIENT